MLEDEYEEISSGWYPASEMSGHQQVILQGGNEIGGLASIDILFETNIEDVFYIINRMYCPIFVIDLRGNKRDIYYIVHLVSDVYKKVFNASDHMPLADNIIIGDVNKHDVLKKVMDFVYKNSDKYEIKISATSKVFNIEVADNHTYYIGEKGLWVHDLTPIDNA